MNKKITILIVSFILFSQSMFSQTNSTVEMAVEQLRKAMVDADVNQLEVLTHSKLSYGHSSGKVEDKISFIASLQSGASDFVTIELSNQTIEVVGSTAYVRHQLFATTNDAGKPGEVKLQILLVWVNENGNWKLFARQAVK